MQHSHMHLNEQLFHCRQAFIDTRKIKIYFKIRISGLKVYVYMYQKTYRITKNTSSNYLKKKWLSKKKLKRCDIINKC